MWSIVQFPNEASQIIEVVPNSWLEVADKTFSYFPPKEEYHIVEQWVKTSRAYSVTWQKFLIKILFSNIGR